MGRDRRLDKRVWRNEGGTRGGETNMGREKSGETDKHGREKHGEKRVRRQESEEIKLGRQEGVNRRERQEWGERSEWGDERG